MKKTLLEKQTRYYNPVWTKEEISVVKRLYHSGKRTEILALLPRRKWDGVKKTARKIGVERIGRPDRRGANFKKLLLENYESYYWMGFIAADGYFSSNRYLGISVGKPDLYHLKKFVSYVDGDLERIRKTNQKLYEFKCGDDLTIPAIKNKFGLIENKTKNPPSLKHFEKLSDENFLSFLIGFIDGDGSICKQSGARIDCTISIGVHASWFKVLNYIENRVYKILNVDLKIALQLTKIRKQQTSFGYAEIANLRFSDSQIVTSLKEFAESFELPFLERKWSKV